MLGALVYGLAGVDLLWWCVSNWIDFARFQASGTGGLDVIVSVGGGDVLVLLAAPLLGSIIVNWMLRSWARRSGRLGILRIHKWSILLTLAATILTPGLMSGQLFLFAWMTPALWAMTYLLTAGLLGIYAYRA